MLKFSLLSEFFLPISGFQWILPFSLYDPMHFLPKLLWFWIYNLLWLSEISIYEKVIVFLSCYFWRLTFLNKISVETRDSAESQSQWLHKWVRTARGPKRITDNLWLQRDQQRPNESTWLSPSASLQGKLLNHNIWECFSF